MNAHRLAFLFAVVLAGPTFAFKLINFSSYPLEIGVDGEGRNSLLPNKSKTFSSSSCYVSNGVIEGYMGVAIDNLTDDSLVVFVDYNKYAIRDDGSVSYLRTETPVIIRNNSAVAVVVCDFLLKTTGETPSDDPDYFEKHLGIGEMEIAPNSEIKLVEIGSFTAFVSSTRDRIDDAKIIRTNNKFEINP